jgi:hypothetical protein
MCSERVNTAARAQAVVRSTISPPSSINRRIQLRRQWLTGLDDRLNPGSRFASSSWHPNLDLCTRNQRPLESAALLRRTPNPVADCASQQSAWEPALIFAANPAMNSRHRISHASGTVYASAYRRQDGMGTGRLRSECEYRFRQKPATSLT